VEWLKWCVTAQQAWGPEFKPQYCQYIHKYIYIYVYIHNTHTHTWVRKEEKTLKSLADSIILADNPNEHSDKL
jgi:hypothetical protein